MASERRRPNQNYKLSNENIRIQDEEKLTFHYDREKRIENAPEIVKKLYEEPQKKFSLLRPLVADKPRAIIFFTIVIISVLILVFSFMGILGDSNRLSGNKIKIDAVNISGVTLVDIEKTKENDDSYVGLVRVTVIPANEEDGILAYTQSINFSDKEKENYSFTVPFSSPELKLFFYIENAGNNSSIVLTVKTK